MSTMHTLYFFVWIFFMLFPAPSQGLTSSMTPFLFMAVFFTVRNCFLLMPFNFSGFN